jgi:hypothetical protein
MRILTVSTILVVGALLSACGKSGEETKTVEWYQQNGEEHQEKLAECKNNPGELMHTPNCMNAQQALMLNMSGPSKVDHSKAFQ